MLMLLQAAADAATAAATAAASAGDAVPVIDPAVAKWVEGLGDQLGAAGFVVMAIQYLKRAPWFAWLNDDTGRRTRLVSNICAFASAMAVNFHLTGDANAGWVLAIPPAHVMWTAFIRFVGAKFAQEAIYNNSSYSKPIQVIPVKTPPMDHEGKPLEPQPAGV